MWTNKLTSDFIQVAPSCALQNPLGYENWNSTFCLSSTSFQYAWVKGNNLQVLYLLSIIYCFLLVQSRDYNLMARCEREIGLPINKLNLGGISKIFYLGREVYHSSLIILLHGKKSRINLLPLFLFSYTKTEHNEQDYDCLLDNLLDWNQVKFMQKHELL